MEPITPVQFESLVELREHEREILERFSRIPNGNRLFLLNPLRALADVGVTLSDSATADLLRLHPNLTSLSNTSYDALNATTIDQPGTVRLKGLFRWE